MVTMRMKRNNACKSYDIWHMLDFAEMYSLFAQPVACISRSQCLHASPKQKWSCCANFFPADGDSG